MIVIGGLYSPSAIHQANLKESDYVKLQPEQCYEQAFAIHPWLYVA